MQSPWFLLAFLATRVLCITELFQNPDFEDPTTSPWVGIGIGIQPDSDAVSGQKSVRTLGRHALWNGVGQVVDLEAETIYHVSGYIKLLSDKPGVLFQRVDITGGYKWPNGADTYRNYASRTSLTASMGWVLLEGAFKAPVAGFTEVTLYLQNVDPGLDFLVDNMSLKKLEPLWKTQADARIEKYRKTDVALNIYLDPGFYAEEIELEIRHKKHSFPFGTLVSDAHVVDPAYQHYRDLLHGMFNWYTVGTYKWDFSQGTPNNPDYTRATQATDVLNDEGLPVRAHAMFWGVDGNIPEWVKGLSRRDLKTAIETRIRYMAGITTGKVKHWDVNNELLHGDYFEEATGDPNYTKTMFSLVREADPDVKLFLNDYGVVARGDLTRAFLDQALNFKAADVGLYGLGLQGHFLDEDEPEPVLIKHRLDLLAEAGLPLWITELDMAVENETRRADWYETAWRLFYSHPAVDGIIMWGFWSSTHYRPFASLVDGNGCYINEAGKRWLKLTKEEWSTHFYHPASNGLTTTFRGFQGSYDVIIRKYGQPIQVQQFELGKTPTSFDVFVEGNGQTIVVEPLPTIPPFANREFPHETYRINRQTHGIMTTSSFSSLICVNRRSAPSAVGDDAQTSVRCEAEEVMTSCSSFTQDSSDFRDGELFQYDNGVPVCVAVNGFQSTAPVVAQARCCLMTGLSCELTNSGPLPPGSSDGDRAETVCSSGRTATGCSAYSWFRNLDGALHRENFCIAQMDGFADSQGAVHSYAFCCSAPNLQCDIQTSTEGGRTKGSSVFTQCAPNQVMLGCSGFSEDGRLAGSRITDEARPRCEAVSGADRYPGEKGILASAVCCTS